MALPPIPAKRYFTIGEVAVLCDVKPYVLRYWEQEFTQLRPMKRQGNRRYYQHHEVLLVRRIRELLYEQKFTISGARNRLADGNGTGAKARGAAVDEPSALEGADAVAEGVEAGSVEAMSVVDAIGAEAVEETVPPSSTPPVQADLAQIRRELQHLLRLLEP